MFKKTGFKWIQFKNEGKKIQMRDEFASVF